MTYQQNPDRVTPPVVTAGGAGLVLAVAARSIIDRYVDPADRELWWNLTQAALFLLPLVGAWIGARFKARNDVTPVKPGDTPRDQDGNTLYVSADVERRRLDPMPGPTRAATAEERWPPKRPPFEAP